MRSEVKGAWFVTARRYVLEEYGQGAFDRYVTAARQESREAIREPLASRWYPETIMRDALEAFYEGVSGRSDHRFQAAMEACAALGTHWFFQMLLSITTPRYFLRLLPTAMRQVRRGPVRMSVDVREHDATLRFEHHPFSDHPQYRLATPAILRAVLRLCVGPSARAELVGFDATTQIVEVGWGDRPPAMRGVSAHPPSARGSSSPS
jgi:hypothetical protein